MIEFHRIALGSVASIDRGISWSNSQEYSKPGVGRVPVLRIGNIQERLGLDHLLYLSGIHPEQLKNNIAGQDSIVMVGSNGNHERVGDCCLITEQEGFLFASFLIGLIPNPEKIDARYLFYVISSPKVQSAIVRSVTGSTGLANLSLRFLRNLEIKVPYDKKVQAKIADVLLTIDRAIEQTETLIAKYRRIKTGLMQNLLTRGIDEKGNLRDPTIHKFKLSPFGSIPAEWEVETLDNQIHIIDCKHYTPKFVQSGYPFIRPRNVKAEGLDLTDVDHVSEEDFHLLTDKHEPGPGDIVLSRNASFGVACYIDSEIPFAIGQDTVIMTQKSANTKFVYHFLRSDLAERQITTLSTGSTFGRINLALIRKLLIPVPRSEEQSEISDAIDQSDATIRVYKDQLDKLQRLKTGLMQDLLTGKVSVAPLLAADEEGKAA